MLALPNQTLHVIDQYGLTREEVDRDAWVIDAEGRKFAGAAAVNRVWRELGGIWTWLARLYRFVSIRWLEDGVYRWVAKHREGLSRVWGAEPEWRE